MTKRLLYIHPHGHFNDLIIPSGAVTCMNALDGPKLGRYSFEVEDDEIREATVVAVDQHWAIGLAGFEAVVRHVRAVNPDAAIVVGGITAGHYPADLLEHLPVDFVLSGDSEVSFRALVTALLEGKPTNGIANVHTRLERNPVRQRMTPAEFEGTDSLTIDWFPSYSRVTNRDSAAYRQARTLIIARGCPLRCPICYGSYASTFGKGVLMRSPDSVVRDVQRAVDEGVRHLRFFLGKPTSTQLDVLTQTLAARGPFLLDDAVGIYLCRALSDVQLDALEAAFPHGVDLTVIPPEDQTPRPTPERLGKERSEWQRMALRVEQSPRTHLDVWNTSDDPIQEPSTRTFEPLGPLRNTEVSLGLNWNLTRPVEGGGLHRFKTVLEAVRPQWSFYAALLLSPALANLLAPYALLDHLHGDPAHAPPPADPALLPWHARIVGAWEEHYLAHVGALQLGLLPLDAIQANEHTACFGRTQLTGALGLVRVCRGDAERVIVGKHIADHRGHGFRFDVAGAPASAFALVPLLEARVPDAAQLAALSVKGLVVLHAPDDTAMTRVQIDVRVQEARATGWNGDRIVATGFADIGYFRLAQKDKPWWARPAEP